MNKAIISCSGGLDSTMLMMTLLAEGREVRAYSFNYGQKHDIELKKVKKNIKFLQEKGYNVSHQIIDLTDVFSGNTSSLVKSTGVDIPKGFYSADNMASTVVPIRNVIFSSIIYSKALTWAVSTDSDIDITLGVHGGDHYCYPDTRKESIDACRHAFEVSDENSKRVQYIAPFVEKTKGEVLGEGLKAMKSMGFTSAEIKKVLKNTHTCYDPNEKGESCGRCGSCTERLVAFYDNDMKDPVPYQEDYTTLLNDALDLEANSK